MVKDPKQLIGTVLNGKYEVLSLLGEGGMGVVFKVRHLILKKRNLFAMKILHPRFSSDPKFHERFLREVEMAMELTHENIVQIRDFGITEHKLLFFTMDFCEGRSLKDEIEKVGAFAPARAAAVTRELLRALTEAHRAGIVHRDLKPDNVIIHAGEERDRVRILDFGIAKIIEGEGESHTLTQGGVIGTPKYMSPEQASGERVDARSDLYSLGVVLYEMLTGRVPFQGRTARSIVMAHITTPPPPFRKIREDLAVPLRLERFTMQLLEKDRERRPASARECVELLADTNTIELSGCQTIAERKRRQELLRPGRRRTALGAVAAILVLVGGVSAWFAVRPGASADALGRSTGEGTPSSAPVELAGMEAGSRVDGSDGSDGPTPVRVDELGVARFEFEICDVCERRYEPGRKASGLCCWLPLRGVERSAGAAEESAPAASSAIR